MESRHTSKIQKQVRKNKKRYAVIDFSEVEENGINTEEEDYIIVESEQSIEDIEAPADTNHEETNDKKAINLATLILFTFKILRYNYNTNV